MENRDRDNNGFGIGHFILRIIVSAIVLAVVAFLTPGFSINGIWPLLIAAETKNPVIPLPNGLALKPANLAIK
jgi:hypothetical protein